MATRRARKPKRTRRDALRDEVADLDEGAILPPSAKRTRRAAASIYTDKYWKSVFDSCGMMDGVDEDELDVPDAEYKRGSRDLSAARVCMLTIHSVAAAEDEEGWWVWEVTGPAVEELCVGLTVTKAKAEGVIHRLEVLSSKRARIWTDALPGCDMAGIQPRQRLRMELEAEEVSDVEDDENEADGEEDEGGARVLMEASIRVYSFKRVRGKQWQWICSGDQHTPVVGDTVTVPDFEDLEELELTVQAVEECEPQCKSNHGVWRLIRTDREKPLLGKVREAIGSGRSVELLWRSSALQVVDVDPDFVVEEEEEDEEESDAEADSEEDEPPSSLIVQVKEIIRISVDLKEWARDPVAERDDHVRQGLADELREIPEEAWTEYRQAMVAKVRTASSPTSRSTVENILDLMDALHAE